MASSIRLVSEARWRFQSSSSANEGIFRDWTAARSSAWYREVIGRDHFTVELPTIGHYPQVEAPAEVVKAYLRFLRQL